ncbi:hypothetical protein CCM_04836 [Cordyceps militaris CM01]|uniref:Uncharacterized protein n=1 Tax=Cordyceps militaris (strain CM01) TaxID=983644 RepID=G3JEW9_CORMM|nr:uncharacterized protein CCM_04836 [Cordyceps militaris CM01]EGX93462.1 hypothetical protein CCM_04836 [Cordyceps militaris CM01]
MWMPSLLRKLPGGLFINPDTARMPKQGERGGTGQKRYECNSGETRGRPLLPRPRYQRESSPGTTCVAPPLRSPRPSPAGLAGVHCSSWQSSAGSSIQSQDDYLASAGGLPSIGGHVNYNMGSFRPRMRWRKPAGAASHARRKSSRRADSLSPSLLSRSHALGVYGLGRAAFVLATLQRGRTHAQITCQCILVDEGTWDKAFRPVESHVFLREEKGITMKLVHCLSSHLSRHEPQRSDEWHAAALCAIDNSPARCGSASPNSTSSAYTAETRQASSRQ